MSNDPVVVREVETKLRVHALFRLPDLSSDHDSGVARVDASDPIHLRAVYHDTVDLRLFRSRMTLRRREGGSDEGWHLKLPVDGEAPGVRDELHLPLGRGLEGSVPLEFADLVLATTRGAEMVPVARLHTHRSPYDLYDADGTHLAELVDDTVSVLVEDGEGGERAAERFRELEVEVRDGSPAAIESIIEALRRAGAVPGGVSKAAHALGPAASAAPDVPEPAAVGPFDPAGAAVKAHLQRHTRALLRQDLRVRRGLPDAVHQFRVAARRLRSGLKVFAPLLDTTTTTLVRDELAWAAGEFGLARDTEVLLERLDLHAGELGDPDAGRARSAIDVVLKRREAAAAAGAAQVLSSPRYVALVESLFVLATQPPLLAAADEPAREVLPGLVDHAWKGLRRHVAELDPEGEAAPWHEARIAAKKARYAAEAVAPVLGAPAKARAEAFAKVTDVLGTHQDAHVAQTFLRDLAVRAEGGAPVSPPVAFALGRLVGIEVAHEVNDRARFGELWPEVRHTLRKNPWPTG